MSYNLHYIFMVILALALSAAFTPVSIRVAHRFNIMDVPKDDRRIHTKPVPRFGGMAIFIAVTVSTIAYLIIFSDEIPGILSNNTIKVLCVGVFVYFLGVLDDKFDLQPKVKLGGQILAGVVLYFLGVRLRVISIFGTYSKTLLIAGITFLITIIWIVGITNILNLIDGVDGLAAGICTISTCCIAYVAYINGYYLACVLMLIVAASSLGFLPFNFNPAKTFMGDSGSMYLGYCIAGFSIIQPVKSAALMALLIPVFVLMLPIFDTLFAIFRRLINGQSIMAADKGHIHHRLMRTGIGQRRTVILLYGVSAIMGIAAVLFSRSLYIEAIGLMAVAFGFIYVFLTDADHWAPKVREHKKDKGVKK